MSVAGRTVIVTSATARAALVEPLERIDGLVNTAGVTHRARIGAVRAEDFSASARGA